MKRLVSIGAKALVSFVLLYAILGIVYNMSFARVLLITIVLGTISYIIGDLILLPRSNNVIATVVDLGLAFSLIWGLNKYNFDNHYLLLFWSSLLSSLAISVFEYYYHIYLLKTFIHEKQTYYYNPARPRYQMETSEELHPNIEKDKSDDTNKF